MTKRKAKVYWKIVIGNTSGEMKVMKQAQEGKTIGGM